LVDVVDEVFDDLGQPGILFQVHDVDLVLIVRVPFIVPGQFVVFLMVVHQQVVHSQVVLIQPFEHLGILLLPDVQFLE
jgi:hypothetical protein